MFPPLVTDGKLTMLNLQIMPTVLSSSGLSWVTRSSLLDTAHYTSFWVWPRSSTFVLETNPQPGGILIESWCFGGNPSINRAAASIFWDKSFATETIKRCNKHLPLVGLGSCQENMFHLPLASQHRVIFVPIQHQSQPPLPILKFSM